VGPPRSHVFRAEGIPASHCANSSCFCVADCPRTSMGLACRLERSEGKGLWARRPGPDARGGGTRPKSCVRCGRRNRTCVSSGRAGGRKEGGVLVNREGWRHSERGFSCAMGRAGWAGAPWGAPVLWHWAGHGRPPITPAFALVPRPKFEKGDGKVQKRRVCVSGAS